MPPSRVKRCLFGRPPSGKVKNELQHELDRLAKEGKTRWNFDFKSDSPLKGRLEWHAVSMDDEDVPMFYGHADSPIKPPRTSQVTQCQTIKLCNMTPTGDPLCQETFQAIKPDKGLPYITEKDSKQDSDLDITVQESPELTELCQESPEITDLCQEFKPCQDSVSITHEKPVEISVINANISAIERKVTQENI